jgi:valyl-tRNA synthetase
MDTWATSSLTPQIAGRWEDDPDLFARVWPMDLRPQAHDIIRTWLFATIVRSHLEFDRLPWSDAAISGWILDPDRKKMSKSVGNVVTPMGLLEQYGSDAVRYWAASARPGTDTAFDEGQMRVGRKLAIKVLNASRFVLRVAGDPAQVPAIGPVAAAVAGTAGDAAVTSTPRTVEPEPLDAAVLASLRQLVEDATAAFDQYDYARALERMEAFFWDFCDNYVELVKGRAYGTLGEERAQPARATLLHTLSVLLRLFAPFLPYVTEEVWSWWHDARSIHRATWPAASELGTTDGEPALWEAATELLGAVRKEKTTAGVSLRAPVVSVHVIAEGDRLARLEAAADDLREAGAIAELRWSATNDPETVDVLVELAR